MPPAGWTIVYSTWGANVILVGANVRWPLLASNAKAPVMVPSKLPESPVGNTWLNVRVNVSLTGVVVPTVKPVASISPKLALEGLILPKSKMPPPRYTSKCPVRMSL